VLADFRHPGPPKRSTFKPPLFRHWINWDGWSESQRKTEHD